MYLLKKLTRIRSIDSVVTCDCGMSKDLVYNKEKNKCSNMIKIND